MQVVVSLCVKRVSRTASTGTGVASSSRSNGLLGSQGSSSTGGSAGGRASGRIVSRSLVEDWWRISGGLVVEEQLG